MSNRKRGCRNKILRLFYSLDNLERFATSAGTRKRIGVKALRRARAITHGDGLLVSFDSHGKALTASVDDTGPQPRASGRRVQQRGLLQRVQGFIEEPGVVISSGEGN